MPLRGGALALLASLTALALPAMPASAQSRLEPVSALISIATTGNTGAGATVASDLSSKGVYVAFASEANNLVAGDTNGVSDVFVRNTLTGTTERVSISSAGVQANQLSDQAAISFDGRYVAFRSAATNLVGGDTNGFTDVFLRDLRNKTTIRVSVKNNGAVQTTGGNASHPSVSNDGTEVSFESESPNVVDFDLNNKPDAFVRNIPGGFTDITTVTSAELALNAGGANPSMTGDGRYVVFGSATTQVGVDTNGFDDIFLRDRVAGTTERVSMASNGDPSDGNSQFPTVSSDGRYIAFQSIATDLTPALDAVNDIDVFRRDRTAATTELVSVAQGGHPANTGGAGPSISWDGTKVAFASDSTNLVSDDTNKVSDTFIRNMTLQTTVRTSVTTDGGQLDKLSFGPVMSPDGTASSFAAFSNKGFNRDYNTTFDLYVRGLQEIGPFGGVQSVPIQASLDFNGKQPSAAEAAAVTAQLKYGIVSPVSVMNAYAHGTFDDHRAPVMRLYWAFFKRMPDLGGLNYWTGKHAKGTTLKSIANSFAKSSEFKTNFGSGTDTQFITLVYTNVLERQPDAAGLAHWVAKLKAGTSRGEMMTNFSEASEGIRKMRGEVDTVLVILGMLHRLPNSGEFVGYTNALELNGGQPTEILINAILTSAEFKSLVN